MVRQCEVNDGRQGYVVWPVTAIQLSCRSACLGQGDCKFPVLPSWIICLVCDFYTKTHFFSPSEPRTPIKWDLRHKIRGENTGRKEMLDRTEQIRGEGKLFPFA